MSRAVGQPIIFPETYPLAGSVEMVPRVVLADVLDVHVCPGDVYGNEAVTRPSLWHWGWFEARDVEWALVIVHSRNRVAVVD